MTNIDEFIEYLQTLPKNTEINVLKRNTSLGYQHDSYSFDDLDINDNIEFFAEDITGPPVLYLGED